MKILDKNRTDYYDGVARQYFDKNVFFNRQYTLIKNFKTDIFKIDFTSKNYLLRRSDLKDLNGNHYSFSVGILGFCNNIYPFVRVLFQTVNTYGTADILMNSDPYYEKPIKPTPKNDYWIFDVAELKELIDTFPKGNNKKLYHPIDDMAADFFNKVNRINFNNLFIEYKTPIFIIEPKQYYDSEKGEVLILNPMIGNRGFERLFPPVQAYQSVYQFISNIAEDRKPIPIIENEDKILTHGFDKFSFRKCKSTK